MQESIYVIPCKCGIINHSNKREIKCKCGIILVTEWGSDPLVVTDTQLTFEMREQLKYGTD